MQTLQQILSSITAIVMALSAQVGNLSQTVNPASQLAQAYQTPAFVQGKASADHIGSTNTLTFTSGVTTGNAIIIFVGWWSTSVTLNSVSDSRGNTYTLIDNPTNFNGARGAMAYALNATGGTNTITVTFSGSVDSIFEAHEVSGIATNNALDQHAIGTVSFDTAYVGPSIITTVDGDYIFAGMFDSTGSGIGLSSVSNPFALRLNSGGISSADAVQTNQGAAQAIGITSANSNMITSIAAFRAVSATSPSLPPTGDTQSPSAPLGFSVIAISTSQINLSWAASTDNVGVAGYKIFRNDSQVATSATNNYSDSGLSANTLYSYTLAAFDAAGNTSSQSSSASATTQAQQTGTCSATNIRCVGSGQEYTTIQACANAAVAGDTCLIYRGSYAGWTQSINGSSGSPITFKANSGDTVTITGGINLSGRSFITIGGPATNEGFRITGGITFSSNNNIIIQNNMISRASGSCMSASWSLSNTSDYIYFLNNTIGPCSNGSGETILGAQGDHWLWDGNTFTRVGNGPMVYGSYHVFRNNHFGPLVAGEAGSEHPDAVEHTCWDSLALKHMLYENNITQEWLGDNAHGFLLRNTQNSGNCTNSGFNIIRLSRFINLGSGFAVIESNMPGIYVYNNSISNTQVSIIPKPRQDVAWYDNSPGGRAINNIITNTTSATAPWCIDVGSDSKNGFIEHNNLCYLTGYSGSWSAPASGLYSTSDKFNQNSLFISDTSNLNLQTTSPAINAGGALTTVASGDVGSGTSLKVNDAGFFQDGYGLTGVQPDWIAVGSVSNVAQISSINYSTNVITLATPLTRSAGAPVYLYKNSSGQQVLYGSAPDIGAYEYVGSQSQLPSPPAGGSGVSMGDLNLDHIVNYLDFSLLNSRWNQNYSAYDLNGDSYINSLDYAIMSFNWLKTW